MSELGKYSPQHRGGLDAGDTDSVDLNHGPHRMNRKQTGKLLQKCFQRTSITISDASESFKQLSLYCNMCLTSDAVYRIRDADAIFRIERKDDQKIAQNTKLFYRNYFEFTTNTSGRVCGTLWRIVSKYILFFCVWFSRFYRRHLRNNVTGTQEDHDRSRYVAYSLFPAFSWIFLPHSLSL